MHKDGSIINTLWDMCKLSSNGTRLLQTIPQVACSIQTHEDRSPNISPRVDKLVPIRRSPRKNLECCIEEKKIARLSLSLSQCNDHKILGTVWFTLKQPSTYCAMIKTIQKETCGWWGTVDNLCLHNSIVSVEMVKGSLIFIYYYVVCSTASKSS